MLRFFRIFRKREDGAVLVYVALALVVMLGVIGLSFDLGRHNILLTELQKAADAAATAGAYQLDPNSDSAAVAARVNTAALGTPITANKNRIGTSTGVINIASVTLLKSIPADDDTPIGAGDVGPPYNYVMVTTQTQTNNNVFGRIVGQPATITLQATAVARKGRAICNITPMMMCLPSGFDPETWLGRQLVLKAGGSGSWTEGNWGLLDTPGGSQATVALAEMIAGTSGLPACIDSSGVDTKPGNVASIYTAFNVRMDLYEPPHFKSKENDDAYPPAENVLKAVDCNTGDKTSLDTRLPRDNNFGGYDSRFGDGNWNCETYWNTVHPTDEKPSDCINPSGMTRYQVYLHEIMNDIIPDTTTTDFSPNGDDGDLKDGGACYKKTIPPTPTDLDDRVNDRRILTVAGVNCDPGAGGTEVKGNTPNVPVDYYLSMFITEAVTADMSDNNLYVEIVGSSVAGGTGPVPVIEREWVEVVR